MPYRGARSLSHRPCGRVRPRNSDDAAGAAQERLVHPLRDGRRDGGFGTGRLAPRGRGGAAADRDSRRDRRGRHSGNHQDGGNGQDRWCPQSVAICRSFVSSQPRRRPDFDQVRISRAVGRAGHRLRGVSPGNWRRGTYDPRGRGGYRVVRRRRSLRRSRFDRRLHRGARACIWLQRRPRQGVAAIRRRA